MTTAKIAALHKPTTAPKDAIALLKADHVSVSHLFAEYEKALVADICTELSVHAQVEEEIFYPEVKRALKDHELVPEATVEHAGLKDLIAQIEMIEPNGETYPRDRATAAGTASRKRSDSIQPGASAPQDVYACGTLPHTESTMTRAKTKSTAGAVDAIAILTEDHKRVKKMFLDFDKLMKSLSRNAEKSALVQEICVELIIHTQIEEEIFYPAVRAAIDDNDLMDEADVEHAGAKELIGQLVDMDPGDDHYDAKVTVLGENIDHHVKEEQDEMFPKAKKAKLDLGALGAKMLKRRQELQPSSGAPGSTKNTRAA